MKQYNPDKPAKYGILFKSLNCARYPYTYQTIVYAGKPTGQPNEFYVKGTINYIKKLVTKLKRYQSIRRRNISMDRLYTSFKVADWLLKRNVTMIGTIISNRVGISPEIKPITNQEENSYLLFWQKDGLCNISSYVLKTAKSKKNVMVVSTVQYLMGVTKDEKTKPAAIKLYDFTKGGTDIVDKKWVLIRQNQSQGNGRKLLSFICWIPSVSTHQQFMLLPTILHPPK